MDRLKQIVRNFLDRRTGLVPGGCPLLNTAIDSDDGNRQLRRKAHRALNTWLDRLATIAKQGQSRGEIRTQLDGEKLATLIVSTLEGSLMLSRLQRSDEPLDVACGYLEEYLERDSRRDLRHGQKDRNLPAVNSVLLPIPETTAPDSMLRTVQQVLQILLPHRCPRVRAVAVRLIGNRY